MEKKKLRILGFKANDGGCAYYRLNMPFQKLVELYPEEVEVRIDDNPLGINASGMWTPDWNFENLKWADVVVINNISNYGGNYSARVVGKAKEFGKFVQMDTDDLLTGLYKEHRLSDVYEEKGLGDITKFMYSHSHLITVTQRKFAERVKPFIADGVLAVVKNAIDYELPGWNHEKIKSKKVRVGWAGGIHHDVDVKEFAGVPHIVNQKVGMENVHWDFYGQPPLEKGQEGDWQQDVWKGYKRELLKGFKGQKNWTVHQALPPEAYGIMYANMDIAIAPLQQNDFNDSKSEIKVAEAGRYKVPLIASNVGCYDETIKNGKTGYLLPPKATRTQWVRILSKVIKEKKHREDMGKNLHMITEQYFDINKVVVNRLSLYEECFKTLKFDPRENRRYEDELKEIEKAKSQDN